MAVTEHPTDITDDERADAREAIARCVPVAIHALLADRFDHVPEA